MRITFDGKLTNLFSVSIGLRKAASCYQLCLTYFWNSSSMKSDVLPQRFVMNNKKLTLIELTSQLHDACTKTGATTTNRRAQYKRP